MNASPLSSTGSSSSYLSSLGCSSSTSNEAPITSCIGYEDTLSLSTYRSPSYCSSAGTCELCRPPDPRPKLQPESRRVRRARASLLSAFGCVWDIVAGKDMNTLRKGGAKDITPLSYRRDTVKEPWKALAGHLGELRPCFEDDRVVELPAMAQNLSERSQFHLGVHVV